MPTVIASSLKASISAMAPIAIVLESAVQITVQGSCKRQLGLPVQALRTALRRDPDAEHVVIIDGGDVSLLSVRTFSPSCTVTWLCLSALMPL